MNERLKRKIRTPDALAAELAAARARGLRVVQCHGCFDLVHPGHVRYLQAAREQGDVLVVSLTGDQLISKGPERPYIPQDLRAENLAALEFVDWVVIDPHPTACELLELLRPDVYVKGREYADSADPRFLRERRIVEACGGRVVFHSGDVVFSSTRLIRGIGDDASLAACRKAAHCRRHAITRLSIAGATEAWSRLRVMIVGDLLLERYIACDASRAAADAPLLDLRVIGSTEYLGGAAALAQQVRALGAAPTVIARAPQGDAARRIADALECAGIEHHLIPGAAELPTRTTVIADDTKLARLDDGRSTPLDSAQEREAVGLIGAHVDDADVLIWVDHGLGMLTSGLIRTVAAAARCSATPIVGGAPSGVGRIAGLVGSDVLVCDERTARGAMNDMGSSLPAVMWNLLGAVGARTAYVALHKRGWLTFDRDPADAADGAHQRLHSEYVESDAAPCVDLLGSDEAALSIAALTLGCGASPALGAYLAAGATSIASRRAGRVCVGLDDLSRWLDGRDELRSAGEFLADDPAPVVAALENVA